MVNWKSVKELDAHFPARLRRSIAEKKMNLYTIDEHAVVVSVELLLSLASTR